MATLTLRSATGEQPLLDIGSRQTVLIGRAPECDVVLANPEVSSRHVRLAQTPQGWMIEDLDSANGTELDGVPLTRMAPLPAGASIMLGGAVHLAFADSSTAAPAAVPAASDADLALVRDMRARTERIRQEVAKVIVGRSRSSTRC